MGRIVAGMASSHAYTFLTPDQWDARRKVTRDNFARRYGTEPPEQPQVEQETVEANRARFGRIQEGLLALRSAIQRLQPEALILIGDDQDENYTDTLPQFAIYTGDEVVAVERGSDRRRVLKCHRHLAADILQGMVEAQFDLASSGSFPDKELHSHAHGPALKVVDPEAKIPVVLIFVNAIHVPAPTPARCYRFGQILGSIIEARPGNERVVLYASGGLSHFTAGFPWPHYQGPNTLGVICEEFDRRVLGEIRDGRGGELAKLSSRDLLDNGNIELRQWIVLLGALGERRPNLLVYEAFYRALLGMGVGYWEMADKGG